MLLLLIKMKPVYEGVRPCQDKNTRVRHEQICHLQTSSGSRAGWESKGRGGRRYSHGRKDCLQDSHNPQVRPNHGAVRPKMPCQDSPSFVAKQKGSPSFSSSCAYVQVLQRCNGEKGAIPQAKDHGRVAVSIPGIDPDERHIVAS